MAENADSTSAADEQLLTQFGYRQELKRTRVIPKSTAFDLGRWAKPLIAIALAWEVILILDFTLPAIFHAAAEVAVGGEVVAAAWYFLGLRGRLRRGEAGQALAKGRLAGADALAATDAAPAAPAPEPGLGA
jgi:hypothetical protein